jgi:phage baseplate assembly protein gpV
MVEKRSFHIIAVVTANGLPEMTDLVQDVCRRAMAELNTKWTDWPRDTSADTTYSTPDGGNVNLTFEFYDYP